MSFLFGSRKTPAELLRENKRMLDKSIREIERERRAPGPGEEAYCGDQENG